MKDKKVILYVILVVLVITTFIILGINYNSINNVIDNSIDGNVDIMDDDMDVLKERNNDVIEEIILGGKKCGNDCMEYINIAPESSEDNNIYKINYKNILLTFSMSDFTNVKYNNKEIYSDDIVPNMVKIFKYIDFMIIHYGIMGAQCDTYEALLIDESGNYKVISEMNKDKIKSSDGDIIPIVNKIDYLDNRIVVYKEKCGFVKKNEHIGFKYTYSLKDKILVLDDKSDIFCDNNKSYCN